MKSEWPSVSPPASVCGETVCQWDATDGTERATLSPTLIGHLQQAAIRGLLAIPKRGVEIGGVLLGQQESLAGGDSATDVFEIAASVDVPCEYRFGPSYILGEIDRANLVELLARHQQEEYPNIVGFYRSYTGREARLDDADQELLRTFFSGHHSIVCLLLQPLSRDACTADVQFWRADRTLEEFASSFRNPSLFEGAPMVQEPTEPQGTAAPAEQMTEDAEAQESVAPEVESEPRPPALVLPLPAARRFAEDRVEAVPGVASRSRLLLASLLLLLAVIGAGTIYLFWTAARNRGWDNPGWAQVRFNAQPSAGGLQLSWDTTLLTVVRATRGVLVVTDGGNAKEIPLSQDQLRRGKFVYAGPTGNTLFHLRIYDKDQTVAAESLRVVQPAISPPAAPEVPTAPVDRLPSKVATALAASPPEVRQEVQPVISPGIRARILSPTVVPVVVKVNESGRVTQASTKVAGHGIQRYLADEAVKAARQWLFRPARAKDGSPVAATKTISFEFTPTAH